MAGNLREGDRVRVLSIPEWLLHGLPLEDQTRLRAVKGRVVSVVKRMPHGYLWLSFPDGTEGFSLLPQDVELTQEAG